ncbi:MAG TPA: helix-turn-helix domain-containing protein [Armatimonadota bacterium]|jgi:excisionase family DNA binding protein
MAEQAKEFYTIKELAALLAVTEQTVYRLMRRGELPYYKFGRATRFRRSDVEAYIARCRFLDPDPIGDDGEDMEFDRLA